MGMDVMETTPSQPQLLEKLKSILNQEKIKKGSFVKTIIDDLKDCTSGKMVELNYLTIKSSYWWDSSPFAERISYKKRVDKCKEIIAQISQDYRKPRPREDDASFQGILNDALIELRNFPEDEKNDSQDSLEIFMQKLTTLLEDEQLDEVGEDLEDRFNPLIIYKKEVGGYFQTFFNPEDFNKMKGLIIDRKYRSSIYDRELPFTIKSSSDPLGLGGSTFDRSKFVNSWTSAQEKINFFKGEKIEKIGSYKEQLITCEKIIRELLGYYISNMMLFDPDTRVAFDNIINRANEKLKELAENDTQNSLDPLENLMTDLANQLAHLFNIKELDPKGNPLEMYKSYKDKILQNQIPKNLEGTIDYGVDFGKSLNKSLDTFPSIYQMTKAAKASKYETKTSCSVRSRKIENTPPCDVILNAVNKIFESDYFKILSQKNHPLNIIIKDHLEKIRYKAQQKLFKQDGGQKEYKRAVIYNKILKNIGAIIELMSVFNIDMTKGQCEIPDAADDSIEWKNNKPTDPYYVYAQLYELFNDLLFLLMYLDDPYTITDFDRILTETYVDRVPLFATLKKKGDVFVASYPMRSGMDAFVNSSMAIGHAPQDISIAPKVGTLENPVYYEISELLKGYPNRGEQKFFVTLNKLPGQEEINKIKNAFIESYVQAQIDKLMVPTHAPIVTNREQINIGNKKRFEDFKDKIKIYFNEKKSYDNAEKYVYYTSVLENNEEFESLKNEAKNYFISEINSIPDNESLFHIKTIGNYTYLEIPMFMKSGFYGVDKDGKETNKLLPSFGKSFQGLMDNYFVVDKHSSITTGITTDSVDLSGKTNYIDKLYRKIDQIIKIKQAWNGSPDPFVILWDVTLEIDQAPCYFLMEKFQDDIESGKIVFVLFKSLQKYANLGIGKSKAGVVTMVGKKTPFVGKIHAKLAEYGKDVFSQRQEYALMTFFYDRFDKETNKPLFQDNEKFYFDATKMQAKRIFDKSKESGDINQYMISSGCLFSPISTNLENSKRISYADTFGFAIPTKVGVGDLIRYSVGLNPKGLQ